MLDAIKNNVIYAYNNAVNLIVKAKAYLFGRDVEIISPAAASAKAQPTKAEVEKAKQEYAKLKASLCKLNVVVQTEQKKLNALPLGEKRNAQMKTYQNALNALKTKTAEINNLASKIA